MLDNSNLLLFLIIVIVTTRLSLLLKKIGQPSLLGELCAGILIAILGFYHLKFFQNLINSQTLAFLSELGAIFLLFEIGVESDFHLLKKNASYAISVASFGALLPFSCGYFFAYYCVAGASQNFCLFVAASLAATSTGISVQIFKEYKLLASRACQVVLAASIIDDILSLVILACISAIASSAILNPLALALIPIKILAFLLGLYLLIKWGLPYFYRIKNKSQVFDFSIIICTCLGAAWLADSVGLSSIMGAFLAGLLMDKNYTRDKQHLILPFTWLCLPIFFIYSGMQVDIQSLANPHILFMASMLSIIAILSKILPLLLIPNSANIIEKLTIGCGMIPRGEIGLIIALLGKQIGVLNDDYFSIITLMIIITSFMAPLLLNPLIKKAAAK